MSSRTDREFLADILEAIRPAVLYVEEIDDEQFLVDTPRGAATSLPGTAASLQVSVVPQAGEAASLPV